MNNFIFLYTDVVSIPKTNENFRLLYDTKGRFSLYSIRDEESKFMLCKVRSVQFGQKRIPYLNTYDGRTIRYPDPLIKANDTIKLDLESNKIVDFIKFDVGNVVMVTGDRNRGRVGVIKNKEKHKGIFETLHIQDSQGHEFATCLGNVFTLGKGTKPWVSLPQRPGYLMELEHYLRERHPDSGLKGQLENMQKGHWMLLRTSGLSTDISLGFLINVDDDECEDEATYGPNAPTEETENTDT
ncbi:hypothetical protein MTR67_025415 [Solanum verrucosum]|uniref:40S ribosomal protein S4 n=1 Tax=Solanum verrucosum TaxID=315347 RepID=A0AAF0R051_SOLVR|nr:hypothetical protein MTR67_025415 [Solanum verrucosum]